MLKGIITTIVAALALSSSSNNIESKPLTDNRTEYIINKSKVVLDIYYSPEDSTEYITIDIFNKDKHILKSMGYIIKRDSTLIKYHNE